jgi:hypothetical protein
MASATAAGLTASQADAITISLVNNYISARDGNHLNADLTGDGHPDLTIASPFHSQTSFFTSAAGFYGNSRARVNLNGIRAYAKRTNIGFPYFGFEQLGSLSAGFTRTVGYPSFFGTYSLTGSIPLFFKDLHIDGGAPTRGLLQVTVSTRGLNAVIQLDSFTYNTPVQGSTRLAAVPDQGSSLALLAMGAGGILALRRWRGRWRAAQAGS